MFSKTQKNRTKKRKKRKEEQRTTIYVQQVKKMTLNANDVVFYFPLTKESFVI